MKNTRILRAFGAAVLSTTAFLALGATSHADLIYSVNLTINQSILSGIDSNGPFYLDFDLTTGSGNVLNKVTLSNFALTGGTFTSGTEGNVGNVTGSAIGGLLTLSDGFPGSVAFDNEDFVAIGAGVTKVSFLVDETNTTETPIGSSTPEDFAIAIQDASGNNFTTTGTVDSSALVYGTSAMGSIGSLGVGNVTGSPTNGVTTAVSVPEPGAAALLLLGVGGLVMRRKRTTAACIA